MLPFSFPSNSGRRSTAGRPLRGARSSWRCPHLTPLLAGLLLAAPTIAQQGSGGYEPIRPIESRSERFGLVDKAPVVQYNEYSGSVSVDLSVGVDGLRLPIHYSNQPRTLQDIFPLPDDESLGHRIFGAGWYVGFGVVSPSGHEPTHYQVYETDRPTEFDRVVLREPNGAENEFKLDLFFQDVPPGGVDEWYNFRFIDSQLRILEREIDPKSAAVATDRFVLLGRDGGRTTFEADQVTSIGQGMFYPTRIEQGDGRTLQLSYCSTSGTFSGTVRADDGLDAVPLAADNGSCADSDVPLLATVADEWGRQLRLHYVTRPATGLVVLDTVFLDAAGHSQALIHFLYQEKLYPGGTKTELEASVTPEGHRTSFHFEHRFDSGDQPIQLTGVDLPTGGHVALEYVQFSEYSCPHLWLDDPSGLIQASETDIVRVSRFSYGGETYEYTYEPGYTLSHLGDDYNASWVVKVRSTQSAVPYERLTQYHHALTRIPDLNHVPVLCEPLAFPGPSSHVAGRPQRRLESYGGGGGDAFASTAGDNFTFMPGGYHTREEWHYRTIPLRRPGNPGGPNGTILTRLPLVSRYWTKRDTGVWIADFDYREAYGTLAGPAFDRPERIRRFRLDQPETARVQHFTYESRVEEGHDIYTPIANLPHVVALQSTVREAIDQGGVESDVAKEVYDYVDEYRGGRIPLLASRRYFTSPNTAETTAYEYYTSGLWHGLPRTEERVGDVPSDTRQTTFEAYRFGIASRVRPPIGPEILRDVRPDGLVRSETRDGVTTDYLYDDDRRRVREDVPGSGQLAIDIEYSPPGADQTVRRRQGSRWLDSERQDAWGRVVETTRWIDDTTSGTESKGYDSLGLMASETSPSGAVTTFTYDVLGRTRTTQTRDAAGALVRDVERRYEVLGGGLDRVVEIHRHPTENGTTRRVTDTDLFGRIVRAATQKDDGPERQTAFDFAFVDGVQRTRIEPAGGAARLEERDWFGRLTMECHPELFCTPATGGFVPDASSAPPVTHTWDALGRKVRTSRSDGSVEIQIHDALDRLIRRIEQSPSGQRIESVVNTYDASNNQLTSSVSDTGGLPVETTYEAFDVLQRPRSMTLDVPDAHPAPTEASPSKYWLFGDTLTLSWKQAVPVDRFEVVVERLAASKPDAEATLPLRFETPDAELVLDADTIRQAVVALQDPKFGMAFIGDLDADPDFLLDPSLAYRWRVFGWRDHEPTLATAWQVLDHPIGPDDCYFQHFRVRDGVREGALVEWRTNNCSETGPLSVEIRATTVDASTGCHVDDALFAVDKNGPKRAFFMVTGYDMVDGSPAFPEDPNAPQCPAIDEAQFRGAILDPDGDEVHTVGPLTGRVLHGAVCDVRNVNVIDGLNGRAPIIRWETTDCDDRVVEVRAEAEIDADHPRRAVCLDPGVLATGSQGQVAADFMVDGYLGADQQACEPVTRAWFRVRVTDPATQMFWETTPELGYVEPVGGFPTGCYTRLFTETSAPGTIPKVAWEATNCEGYAVEVTRTSVGLPSDLRCIERGVLWQTDSFGVRSARFMVDGFTHASGVACDPLADALANGRDRIEYDFEMNIRDPATGTLVEPQSVIKSTARAAYLMPTAGSPDGPCRIDYFGVSNGFHGDLPVAAWGTSGDCRTVELQVWTPSDFVGPCALDGDVWSAQPDGPSSLTFMVGGYDVGLGNNHDGQWDCVGEPGANGTYGEALTEAHVALQATAVDGSTVRWPETGELLVTNHNDQSQSTLPGPNDPCSLIDFAVDQAPVPGRLRTDSVPVVDWRTDCPAQSRYSVRVYASAESIDYEPGCRLDDMLFQSSKNGPHTATFIRSGWFDYVLGEHRCYARRASFRIEIVDDATGVPLPGQSAGPIEVEYSGPLEGDPPIGSCEGDTCTAVDCTGEPKPTFYGLTSHPRAHSDCRANLAWPAATSNCDGDVVYTVYRSSQPHIPRVDGYRYAEGITTNYFTDTDIVEGGTYYYMVTATDTVSLAESEATPVRRLDNDCVGGGTGSFKAVPSTIQSGQSTTLTWDFPEALFLILVGYGEQPTSGQLTVTPTGTTLYQMHLSFGAGQTAFTAEVTVEGSGSDTPVAHERCYRPCAESVLIDGVEHFCRGLGAWDDDYEVTQPPVWLTTADWPRYVETPGGDPISPYCLKAKCGLGDDPPYAWHRPGDVANVWWHVDDIHAAVEYQGDGLDNDCDGEIDEIDP